MRLKRLENQWRVWLNRRDYQLLRENAISDKADLAIRLGAEVGLRVSESTNVKLDHVRDSTHPEVDAWFIGVYGKDTTGKRGEMGKYREAFIPGGVLTHAIDHAFENSIGADEELLPVTKRTVQAWIKQSAEATAEATGIDDFNKVSSHDLRAYYATDCMVRRGMNPRVIMEVGGWTDFKSVKPYLNAQFDDVIADEFDAAGFE